MEEKDRLETERNRAKERERGRMRNRKKANERKKENESDRKHMRDRGTQTDRLEVKERKRRNARQTYADLRTVFVCSSVVFRSRLFLLLTNTKTADVE